MAAFAQSSAGNPAGAATLRTAFHNWLRTRLALSPEQLSDLTLAVNEALANAVEHAYIGADNHGRVELQAQFEAHSGDLVVTIRDHGIWRKPTPDPRHLRGRGIPLIRALATSARIETDESGTCVELRWSRLFVQQRTDNRPGD